MNHWKTLMDNDEFQTGDILLFHHKNNYSGIINTLFSIFETLIMKVTNSKYTHSAIIVKDPNFTEKPLKGLYILESSVEPFRDAEDNKYKFGVELEEFSKVMNEFKGSSVYWRKLNCTRNTEFYDTLDTTHKTVHNKPYDILPSDWIKAALNINKGDTQSKKRFWCSALVAYIYVCWGFLPKDTPWTIVSPKMLGTEKPDKQELQFTNCTVNNEVRIL